MSEQDSLHTDFAPPERAPASLIAQQARLFAEHLVLRQVLDAMPSIVVILNHQRQIVYANQVAFEQLGIDDPQSALGLRPGELLGCVRACQSPSGCGTTLFCSECGAVRAILFAQGGNALVEECRILREQNGELGALDLRVVATPFEARGDRYVIFALNDISAEKRRQVLERIFFHDVLNTAGALRGAVQMMADEHTPNPQILLKMLPYLSERLINELQAQKDLLAAESGDLSVQLTEVYAPDLLSRIAEARTGPDALPGRQVCLSRDMAEVTLVSDPILLERVLDNMVKNALETSVSGQVVTLGCRAPNGDVEFWVHNETAMPREVQLQVFQRSFSTKGVGRGLGTYSMKLLTERYLGGQIGFSSSEEEGTTFWARYPRVLSIPP